MALVNQGAAQYHKCSSRLPDGQHTTSGKALHPVRGNTWCSRMRSSGSRRAVLARAHARLPVLLGPASSGSAAPKGSLGVAVAWLPALRSRRFVAEGAIASATSRSSDSSDTLCRFLLLLPGGRLAPAWVRLLLGGGLLEGCSSAPFAELRSALVPNALGLAAAGPSSASSSSESTMKSLMPAPACSSPDQLTCTQSR